MTLWDLILFGVFVALYTAAFVWAFALWLDDQRDQDRYRAEVQRQADACARCRELRNGRTG